MKANQKFLNEEEAVSPVIAVILMVAITVVLAATVFVLVNDLGKNVGQTGPSLGLVSDSAQSSTSQWAIKVSSATKLASLTDYRFVLTTPSHGTVVAVPTETDFSANGEELCAIWATGGAADLATRTDANLACTDNNADAEEAYRFVWTDIDGNDKWSVGDTLRIDYDGAATLNQVDDGEAAYESTFDSGEYTLEILHTPSGSSTASLPRTF